MSHKTIIIAKLSDLQQRVRYLEHQNKVSRRFEIALLVCWLFVSITHVAAMVWRIK